MHDNRLKKWEAALLLSLCITFCHGAILPNAVGCNWWGVVFSGLAEAPAASTAAWSAPGMQSGGVELRFRVLDLLAARLGK